MFIENARFIIYVEDFGTHIYGYELFTVNDEPVPMREPYEEEKKWYFKVGDVEVLFDALARAKEEPHLTVETPCNFISGKVNDFEKTDDGTLRITLDGEYKGTYAGLTYGRWMGVKARLIGNPKVSSTLVGEIDWNKYCKLRGIFLAEKRILIEEEAARQTLGFLRENAASIAEALMVAPESFTEQVQNWAQNNISLYGQINIRDEEEDEEVAEQLRKLEQAIVLAKANDWKFLIEA